MDITPIKKYYAARGLQSPSPKDALWFFFSEVGELAEAYLEQNAQNLTAEEVAMLQNFTALGLQADEIVSRVAGWVRNHDRLRKNDALKEVADCNMMLSVYAYADFNQTPDEALLDKMKEKLGGDLSKVLD